MKRKLLLLCTILLSVLSTSYAIGSDRYWVGGSGEWSNTAHWSASDGGNGGASVPGKTDRVYFNKNSFGTPKPIITITDSAFCSDFICSETPDQPVFRSAGLHPVLVVSGSFSLPAPTKISFKYAGKIIFTSSSTEQVDFGGSRYEGTEMIFDGSGTWNLVHDLFSADKSTLMFRRGHLQTHDHSLLFGQISGDGKQAGILDLGKSNITIFNKWLLTTTSVLKVNASQAHIFFNDTIACENFRTRAMGFNTIHTALTCNNPPLSVTLTSDSVVCNGQSNGSVNAVAAGGSGFYTYLWSPSGCTSPSCSGLGANTYLVTVTDTVSGDQISCSIGISAPAALVINFSITSTLPCNGSCTGAMKANPNGGNCSPGYTYSWTSPVSSANNISGLCAGTYTLTVTDCKGCTATTAKVLGQPTIILPHGTSTNVTCFGACNGTATVAPTGGTPGYTYSWAPGGSTASSISNLCPGNYTCTVTDANNCTKTYIATITQPAAPLSAVSTTTNNPLSCNGDCNATINVAVSGGTPGYTYSWSPGSQTTPSLNNLCAGTYVLHTTDAHNCPLLTTVIINQPAPLAITLTAVNLACHGACNGSLTAVVTGGTGAYTYSWSPVAGAGATLSGLCAGNYTVTVTDAAGCTQTATGTITQPTALSIGLTPVDITCHGLCNGTVSSSVSGGTGVYTYSWTPGNPTGQGTGSISNLCPGTYTLSVHDANGCNASTSVTITQPPLLVPNASATNQSCAGVCDGQVIAIPSGGNPLYTYSWTPGGATTQSVTNLCAGTFTVTVTDASGCTKTQAVTISAPAPIVISFTNTNISCSGLCNGSTSASVTGGTAPYTYSWNTGATTTSLAGLCVGSYTLTVTDANGCTSTNSTSITTPSPLIANASALPASCAGLCSGSATAAPTGGTSPYTYSWTPGGQTTQTINGQCVGAYTISVTDGHGCNVTQTVNVTSPLAINPNVSVTNVRCAGNCNGTATAAPTGGTGAYTYSWNTGALTSGIVGLCAGSYTCTVKDAHGCSGTQIVSITQPLVLSASVGGSTTTCGNCQGSATVSVSGGTPGYTYSWNTIPSQSNPTATSLCVGSYTCTVTDANGCSTTVIATITQTVNINITSSATNLTCHNICNASASANASGGTPPYTYSWNSIPAQTGQNAINLCAGTYSVTVDDVNGCFSSAGVTFTNPPLLSPSVSELNTSCNGLCNGSASASVTGGTGAYSYSWTPGGQTTSSVSALCAGTYTLDVKDANGCDSVQTFNVTQPAAILPHPSITTPSTCAACDGALSVAPTGGTAPYTYSWAGGQLTSSISGLCAGSYTVTVHDNSGCDTVVKITLSSPSGPSAVMSFTPTSCSGACDGTATAVVSGGTAPYTYSWSPGAPTGGSTTHITALCAGTYTIQVIDHIGCTILDPVTVTQPLPLTLTPTVTNVSCGGANDGSIKVVASGGTLPYIYTWTTGQTTSVISGLSPGNYTITVTDANNCSTNAIYTITQPAVLNVTITTTNVSCNGLCNGTATAVPTGGSAPYTYSWSTGATASNITNLCPGIYTVKVTDLFGCSQSQTCTITQPTTLTSSITATNATCFGVCNGTAFIAPAGGTPPYTYLWAPGSQTNDTIIGLCAGAYSGTTTDSKGCTSVSNTNITEPTALAITMSSVNATCNGSCNGSATAVVTGGTGLYTYSWTPSGGTGPSAIGLCSGTYTFTVTDANGCTASTTVTITQPAPLLCNASGVNPSCNGSCNGTATSSPVGGTAPFTYSWSTGATTQSISSLCAGTYTITTTDSKGCSNQQTVVITDPGLISSTNAVADANCGVCNGTIGLIPSGGTSPYSYTWLPAGITGQGTPNVSLLCAGNYIVKITDANGCSATLPAIVVNNTGGPTGETVTITAPTCSYSCNASAVINSVTGGTPGYTYTWFDSLGTNLGVSITTITNLCRGGYIARVTDANGCIYAQNVEIGSPAPILSNSSVISSTCTGLCNASINVAPTGGTGIYTYQWSPGGQTTPNISNLCAGADTVKITDGNGCDSVFTFLIAPVAVLSGTVTEMNPPCGNACGGTASISMTSGTAPYTFQWTDPLGQTSATATNLCAGTYTVNVIDANGCNIQPTALLNAPSVIVGNPVVSSPSCGQCNGTATVSPSGGTAPYTYQWSTGATTASINNLCAGVYSVTVNDANSCSSSVTLPVSNSSGPTASTLSVTPVSCNGLCNGSATATGNGGSSPYTYHWLPGGQNTSTITAQCAGLYFVQVTDVNGCVHTDSVTITQPAGIISNQTLTPARCGTANGAITVSPSGGTSPYTYAWSGALPPVSSQSSLAAGIYTVAITDAAGCQQTFGFTVNTSNSPILTNVTKNDLCNGTCNGLDTVKATGGSPGYTYSWIPAPGAGAGTNAVSLLCAGNYTVQVTDAAGCANSAAITITQPQPVSFSNPQITNLLCNGLCNGKATAIPSGGTAPYTYSWQPGAGSLTPTDTGLCAGSYTLTLTDKNGCVQNELVTITQPLALAFTSALTSPPCDNAPGGSIAITSSGGTSPYTYSWTGPGAFTSTSQNINSLLGGDYTLTVKDANGCKEIVRDTLKPIIVLDANAGVNKFFCSLGPVTLDGSASINAFQYKWYLMPGGILADTNKIAIVNPPAGTTVYDLIVFNGGCTDTATVSVTSNSPPTVSAGPDQSILTNSSTTIGGNPTCISASTFLWSPSTGLNDTVNSNPIADPLVTTTYVVTVTDVNGCKGSDTVVVTVLPEITFPNGITPNGDGVNDVWIIANIQNFPNNVVEIYNRWGERLFQAKDYQNNWNGMYQGKPLPVGTYYYLIDLHDPKYATKYSGPITIMR